MSEISFLCGLGNPGTTYSHTRHNLGFDTLDLLAERHGLGWKKKYGKALVAEWNRWGRRVVLIKPQTFMNLSSEALSLFGLVSNDSLLVICDDINLSLGQIRIRRSGGSGGHRGLESISEYLATGNYARLRMGVGPVSPGEEWSDFVLENFLEDEKPAVTGMIKTAVEAAEMIIREGIGMAQQEFNGRFG